MYTQHMHMVFRELHIFHDLVLNQNVINDAYSMTLLHEALDVYHKMVMLVIGWYPNTLSIICVKHQNYNEHDTLCLIILFYSLFSYILFDQWIHVYDAP